MKERIVLEEHEFYNLLHFLPTQMVKIVKKERKALFIGKEIKPEKVPETFEELKDLCKDIKEVTITKEGYINVGFVYFTKEGHIESYIRGVLMSCMDIPVAKNRTPQQMWQIIKNLIGEE